MEKMVIVENTVGLRKVCVGKEINLITSGKNLFPPPLWDKIKKSPEGKALLDAKILIEKNPEGKKPEGKKPEDKKPEGKKVK